MSQGKKIIVYLSNMPTEGADASSIVPTWLSVSCSITHGYIKVSALESEIFLTKLDVNNGEESSDQSQLNILPIQSLIFRPDSRFYFEKDENKLTNQIVFPTSSSGSFSYRVGKADDGTYAYPQFLIFIAQNDTLEPAEVYISYHKEFKTDSGWEMNKDGDKETKTQLEANESVIFNFQFQTT